MSRENLYFIAILPPKTISDEITAFKNEIAQRFNSMAALKVMPHITLKAPFKLAALQHDDLMDWFQTLTATPKRFHIELKNFGCFENKQSPVIYVQPVMNDSLLSLQKEIIRSFHAAWPGVVIMDPDWRFKPHITIAYRDLEPADFPNAWTGYQHKEYNAGFETTAIHLLQHTGRTWTIIDTLQLPS